MSPKYPTDRKHGVSVHVGLIETWTQTYSGRADKRKMEKQDWFQTENRGCVTGWPTDFCKHEQEMWGEKKVMDNVWGELRERAPCGSSLTALGDRVDNLLMAARSLALCPSGGAHSH